MTRKITFQSHPGSRRSLTLFAASWIAITSTSLAADDWAPNRVYVTGSEERVWVIAESRAEGDKLPEVRFWTTDDGTPSQKVSLQPVAGTPVAITAADKSLRILYGDLSLWRYEADAAPATDALYITQAEEPPLAVASDTKNGITWFLVDADALRPPDSIETTQPVDDSPSTTRPVTTRPADTSGLALLRLQRGFWSMIDIPKSAVGNDEYRMTAGDNKLQLFWMKHHGTDVRYITLADDAWTTPALALSGTRIDRWWAASSLKGPVLIVATPTGEKDLVELSVAFQSDDGWTRSKPAGPGSTSFRVSADKVAATVAQEKLAVACIDGNKVRFGWGDISASPTLRFNNLSSTVLSLENSQQHMRDFVEMAVLLALFTIALLSRREQMQTPAAVPKGYVLATIWRRGLATLIDISPAVIAIYLLYGDSLRAFVTSVSASGSETVVQDPAQLAEIEKIRLLLVVIYGAWCTVLELLGHTTLGKRIFNCRVLSADGTAPTGRQILIRNLLRVAIVWFGPKGLLVTFMLMSMFTINRQRLGDIMGNTIVVHPAPLPLDDGEPYSFDDRDSQDRF